MDSPSAEAPSRDQPDLDKVKDSARATTAAVRSRPSRDGVRSAAVRATALSAALLAAWFSLFAVFFSSLQEHGSQARLYGLFRSQLANETAPYQAPIPAGAPVALLSIGRLGISRTVVVEGTTSQDLRLGPGLEADTPLPGQAGTAIVMGRALSYGGPFAQLATLHKGDRILVTTAQGLFSYTVQDVRHAGQALPAPVARGEGRLTLITASGGWLGRLTPTKALYVDAQLAKGQAQPVPVTLPSIGPSARPMQGNTKALVPLIFWLEALVLATGLVALGWWRWGRWQTWLAGVPIVVGVCWGMSDSVMQLLPNLF